MVARSLEDFCSPAPRVTSSLSLTSKMAEEERLRAEIRKCWEDFVVRGKDPRRMAVVRPEIAESWIRSKDYGVDPQAPKVGSTLGADVFNRLLDEKRHFLEVALPFAQQLSQLVFFSGHIVVLVDERGTILSLMGDPEIMSYCQKINLIPGAQWSEEAAGTTSSGLCAHLGIPMQAVGAEHYSATLHATTCSSAPVFDPEGELLGVLSVASLRADLYHPHTLGMVASIAWAIQNQLRERKRSLEVHKVNHMLSAILASTSEAILTVSAEGCIVQANSQAQEILGRPAPEVIGSNFESVMGKHPVLTEALGKGQSLAEAEVLLETPDGKKLCHATTRPILGPDSEVTGLVVNLKTAKSVHSLASRLTGLEAIFSFQDIIGNAPAFEKCKHQARLAAHADTNVLLIGETGTGKELFAQAIHNASACDGPFVALNCAAIPRTLIESELFGYEGGTFTGGHRQGRPGKFELAQGGTLFLDEIGEMPLELQPVLLRVLEEKKVMRLGGNRYTPINCRVIAASNRDLDLAAREGYFRKDLYYRLAVFLIEIPPLRNRPKDIELLVKHFLEKISLRLGKNVEGVSPEVHERFLAHDWSGNVRELENVLEYMVITTRNEVLQPADLPDRLRQPRLSPSWSSEKCEANSQAKVVLPLEQAEKQAIVVALRETRSIREAAQVLRVGRNTLHRKIKQYGLNPSAIKAGHDSVTDLD